MAGVWEAYRQWVLQGGDSQIRTFSTFSQLLLGYNGDILDYVWKNELFSSALGIVEHVNGEIKRKEDGERVSVPLSIVKMIRIVQRAVEVLLRMYVVGRIHWPWETPRLVKQAIVAIELVKAVLLLYVNKHISHFLRTLRVYCRSLPKGRRTGMRVPLVSEGRHPSLPPVLTVWDVLQPLADAATVVRPLLYSSLLLRYHNRGRPWRALLASLLLEACVFLVTFIKGKADSEQARLMRKRDQVCGGKGECLLRCFK